MGKHRVGDRRIITVSLPEDLARRLDARVEGKIWEISNHHWDDRELDVRSLKNSRS